MQDVYPWQHAPTSHGRSLRSYPRLVHADRCTVAHMLDPHQHHATEATDKLEPLYISVRCPKLSQWQTFNGTP